MAAEPRDGAFEVTLDPDRSTAPDLAVVVLVGPHRGRTESILEALGRQDGAADCEVLLVGTESSGAGRAPLPAGVRATWLEVETGTPWGAARAAGVRMARAPVVAFVEDHCLPEPGWADAVLRGFADGIAAVGYAFTNGSPDRLLYRTILLTEYGPWLHPTTSRDVQELPSNNVAYRRADLLDLGDRLGMLLEIDFNLHRVLRGRGLRLWLAADAVVAHQSSARLKDLFRGHFAFARLLAVRRADLEGWSRARRLAQGVTAPLIVPLLRLVRMWRTAGGRPGARRRLVVSLPLLKPLFLWASFGESAGCLFGAGRAPISLATMELEWPRASRARPE